MKWLLVRKSKPSTKISTLSSENVGKYEFSTNEDVLPEKDLFQKAATIKRYEYIPLDSKLKK